MKRVLSRLACLLVLSLVLTGCSEIELASHVYKTTSGPTQQGNFKVGKPYNVMGRTYYPQETYSYTETGIASWYGPGFHGKSTASGEKFNQKELTAAHRTLQMPSLVRVTNLDNGRSVVVRVNDRGPFSRGRIIDVSERAAELLGMKGTGTAKVKLELLANESKMIADAARRGESTKGVETAINQGGGLPPSVQQASAGYQPAGYQTATVPSVETASLSAPNVPVHVTGGVVYPDAVVTQVAVTPSKIYVQAGAFGQQDNAIRLSQKLQALGTPAQIQPVSYQGRTLYKVRMGPLDSVRSADTLLTRVLASGHSDAIIIVD